MKRNQFMNVASRYVPKGAVKVADKKSDAVAYLYTQRDRPCMVVYYGKQSKPVAHFVYATEEKRAKQQVAEYFAGRENALAFKADRMAKRKAYVNDWKVGEIVNTCWGYDQTNREFYEIVAVKGKQVTLRQIACKGYSTGWCQDKVGPMPGQYVGEPFTRLAQDGRIKIGKYNFTYASRTSFKETVPGVKVYELAHTSSYA